MRPRAWRGTRSSATSRSSTTRTPSPSRTRPRSRSPRTSRSATRPTAGRSRPSTGAGDGDGDRPTSRTSTRCWRPAKSRRSASKPTLIILRTIIAWPSPTKQDTGKSHGSALGDAEIAGLKELLGFDPKRRTSRSPESCSRTSAGQEAGQGRAQGVGHPVTAWRKANAERAALLDRLVDGALPAGLREGGAESSRRRPQGAGDARGIRQGARRPGRRLPELWGGSADLAESNNTTMAGPALLHPEPPADARVERRALWRTLHFGIREFGMGLILNGIALSGLTRPYGGTFLVFSDYMRAAVRLAAIQQLGVTFVWTHDSIGLGEDGPTHQPIEHLASLRAMPGLRRGPPRGRQRDRPGVGEILRRDPRRVVPVAPEPADVRTPRLHGKVANGVQGRLRAPRGGESGTPDVILVATGSEVALALAARRHSSRRPRSPPAWSPCRAASGSSEQSAPTSNKVLPAAVRARVSCRGRGGRWAGATWSATPARSSASSTSAPPPTPPPSSGSSGSPPRPWSRPPRQSSQAARKAGQVPDLTETAPGPSKDTGTDVGTPRSRKSAATARSEQ
jgi:transketolase